ncbi:hypothetical protein [Streptomyces sp. NPDC001774]
MRSDAAEIGHAEVDGGSAVELREFRLGAGEADFEPFDLAEPALSVGFGNASNEVVTDFCEARPLCGIWAKHGTPDAGVFMDAGCAVGAPAGAERNLASFEVTQEFFPFLFGGSAVFLAGADGSTS